MRRGKEFWLFIIVFVIFIVVVVVVFIIVCFVARSTFFRRIRVVARRCG